MAYSFHLLDSGFNEIVSDHSASAGVTEFNIAFGALDIHNIYLTSSNAFSLDKIEFLDGASWEEKTSDTFWNWGGSGTWDGAKWVADLSGATYGVVLADMSPVGVWTVGYRPTKVRLTITGPTASLSASATSKIIFTEVSPWADGECVWLDGEVDWYSGTKYPIILIVREIETLTWTISYVYPSISAVALKPSIEVSARSL